MPTLPVLRRSTRPFLDHLFADPPRLFEVLALVGICSLSLALGRSDSGPFILKTLRLFASLSLIAFIPGYLLAVLLFGAVPRLSPFWLLGLGVTFSFSILIFDGVLFNALGIPITGLSLLLSQVAWTFALLAASIFLSRRIRPQNLLFHRLLSAWRAGSAWSRSIYAICAFLVILYAGSLSYALFAAPTNELFTELSIQDPQSLKAGPFLNVPRQKDTYDLSVSVVNREKGVQSYTLVLSISGYSTQIPLLLGKDEAWSRRLTVPLDTTAPSERLQVRLYRSDRQEPYRQTHLWIHKDSSPDAPLK
jgi:uncharacterized membrane protein